MCCDDSGVVVIKESLQFVIQELTNCIRRAELVQADATKNDVQSAELDKLTLKARELLALAHDQARRGTPAKNVYECSSLKSLLWSLFFSY